MTARTRTARAGVAVALVAMAAVSSLVARGGGPGAPSSGVVANSARPAEIGNGGVAPGRQAPTNVDVGPHVAHKVGSWAAAWARWAADVHHASVAGLHRRAGTSTTSGAFPSPLTAPVASPAVFEGVQPLVPSAPPGWTITAHHLRWGGLDRYFLMARPAESKGTTHVALPVLVVLHGRMMTPAGAERLTGFLAEAGQAVVIYPAGYDESWNAGYCCGPAHRAHMNDVGFIESVIRYVVAAEPGVSPHDVYLVGYSNGGRMAYRLACADPGGFAGVAAVEAVPVSTCSTIAPVPLMVVASTNDPLLTIGAGAPPKYVAGRAEVGVQALMGQWRQLDGCAAAATVSTYGAFTATDWSHCATGARMELALYRGGSHAWVGGGLGTPSDQEMIWSFFHGEQASGR